jgi:hypothetical protein
MPPIFKSLVVLCGIAFVAAQPSPEQQQRIATAIRNEANKLNPDYTAFVNPFIGTSEFPRDLVHAER